MEISRHWRLRKQRYGLVGEVCPRCDAKIFPPKPVCPECGGEGIQRLPILLTRESQPQPLPVRDLKVTGPGSD